MKDTLREDPQAFTLFITNVAWVRSWLKVPVFVNIICLKSLNYTDFLYLERDWAPRPCINFPVHNSQLASHCSVTLSVYLMGL